MELSIKKGATRHSLNKLNESRGQDFGRALKKKVGVGVNTRGSYSTRQDTREQEAKGILGLKESVQRESRRGKNGTRVVQLFTPKHL